jgi:hypothetical protein
MYLRRSPQEPHRYSVEEKCALPGESNQSGFGIELE